VLPAAADWLQKRFGHDLGDALLVLPAARAGRRLTELLAERFDVTPWTPPVLTTLSGLPARLTAGAHDPPRLEPLDAAWLRAVSLRSADRATLEAVIARPPGPDDWRGWLALARQLGRLDDELAGARLTADDVPARAAEAAVDLGLSGERWQAIAALQRAYDAARGDRHDAARRWGPLRLGPSSPWAWSTCRPPSRRCWIAATTSPCSAPCPPNTPRAWAPPVSCDPATGNTAP